MRLAGLVLVSAIGLCPAAWADDTPAGWLTRMSDAARTENYQGVVIYRGDDMLETFRVAHRYDKGDERERVQSLTGEVREILKHDDKVIFVLPKDQPMTVDQPTPKRLFPGFNKERLDRLAQVYQLKDLGEARIAGRQCKGIAIKPRDEYRYGYEVWADKEKGVPLKVSLISQSGKIIEQMLFTEVEFPKQIPDSEFEAEFDPATMRKVIQSSAGAISAAAAEVVASNPDAGKDKKGEDEVKDTEWRPGQLPPGFQVTMRDVRTLSGGRGEVEHVVVSDGLSTISIFRAEQHIPAEQSFNGVSQMGAVNVYGRVVGHMHITVLGEVPPETVRMIGDSFRASAAASQGLPVPSLPAPQPTQPLEAADHNH